MSDYMEPVRLRDVIRVLEEREQHIEAFYYGVVVPLHLEVKHGIPFEVAENLTTDEIIELWDAPSIPSKYRDEGWNFWWGEEAFKNTRNED